MKISLAHILLAIELGFLFFLAWHWGRESKGRPVLRPVYSFLLWVTAYGLIATGLGAQGLYTSNDLLRTLPGLWLPLATVGVVVTPIVVFKGVRKGLGQIFDHTPWHWFAYFHGLRIAALGTAYKTMIGEFPAYFEYAVGIPDLIFGLSAFWIARKAQRGELSGKAFWVWNLIGVLVIVPSVPILLQLGLPGPIQVFTSVPDARAVLAFPMSIAPTIGVPLFVLVNLWVVWRLWENRVASNANRDSTSCRGGPISKRQGTVPYSGQECTLNIMFIRRV